MLPITSVGTVRPLRSICVSWPISSTSTRAHAPRPAGGVAENRSCRKWVIAGSASAPTAIIFRKRRLPGWVPLTSGAPPTVRIMLRAAAMRADLNMPGTENS